MIRYLLGCTALFVQLVFSQPSAAPGIDSFDRGNLPSQKIGKDDLIHLSVYGAPELSRTIRVAEDGTVRVPLTKASVAAAGLMPRALESAIADAIRSEKILLEPLVTVTVTEYRSRPVSVVGAVLRPTTFQATGEITLLEAIGQAGGLTPTAGGEILISKSGSQTSDPSRIQRVSLRDLIDEAKPEANLKLEGGEQIRVPEAGKIFVLGNVKKPGIFPIHDDAGTTVLKMLAQSEGLSPYAAKVAYIYRRPDPAGQPNEIPVEIRKLLDRKQVDIPLQANDIFYVPEDGKRRATYSTLEKVLMFGSASSAALIYGAMR